MQVEQIKLTLDGLFKLAEAAIKNQPPEDVLTTKAYGFGNLLLQSAKLDMASTANGKAQVDARMEAVMAEDFIQAMLEGSDKSSSD